MPEIQNTIDGFAVITNTDLTEGKGARVIKATCTSIVTAERLARGVGVQGCDADVVDVKIYQIDGMTYAPTFVVTPNTEDALVIDRNRRKAAAKERLMDLGVSFDELKRLIEDLAG